MQIGLILLGLLAIWGPPTKTDKPKPDVKELRAEVKRLQRVVAENHETISQLKKELEAGVRADDSRSERIIELEAEKASLRRRLSTVEKKEGTEDGIDLFMKLRDRGALWAGAVEKRQDEAGSVHIVCGNQHGEVRVQIVAWLRQGQSLERLTVGRRIAVRGRITKVQLTEAGWVDPETLVVTLVDATIERGPE